jgi:hypothetical protein
VVQVVVALGHATFDAQHVGQPQAPGQAPVRLEHGASADHASAEGGARGAQLGQGVKQHVQPLARIVT